MTSETRSCQNCKTPFTIEPDDFTFYEKMQVPPPTFCPECRLQRRLTWRNESMLHKDTCKLCGKSIITTYNPAFLFTVYCNICWFSDKWDPSAYGKEYDFSKPFLEQFGALLKIVPKLALIENGNVRSEYTNYSTNNKNCYLAFSVWEAENVNYATRVHKIQDSMDCYSVTYSSQCYECIDSHRNNKVFFSQYTDNCADCMFLYDCKGCITCIASAGLRNKSNYFLNQPVTNEEIKQIGKRLLSDYPFRSEVQTKWEALSSKIPRRYAQLIKVDNCQGNNIKESKNCRFCFDIENSEEGKYIFDGAGFKDGMDVNFNDKSELVYEVMSLDESSRSKFSTIIWGNSSDIEYSHNCASSASHCFGCDAIRGKSYCILNTQYSAEEYNTLLPKIRQHMSDMPYRDTKGIAYTYGEFLPSELSPFPYNDTKAQETFPLVQTEAEEKGFKWTPPVQRAYTITKKGEDIPENSTDVDEEILQDIIGCEHEGTCKENCSTAFRIITSELQFYKIHGLPLPHLCPNCRHHQRLNKRESFRLYHRKCQCTSSHIWHDSNQACPNEFETTYAPDRPEIVYCENCYQQEVI
ncbi:MAG: hypothetical protein A3A33_02555 [Candidatus Yanofskybacteria bacterium RIFCSPLOWO2_01_FULL_49_25]|uniref:Uncharacterized protein n=1 Tax=Candidatus Yanofskybacteria bacterium RIFCSPLOWO2_01_FULL_49_25 TaxID=1802701 RepID=A0A1F8GS03_9BACT|nr:MAG: hypothetical protein A3A33_02555 [Candidatus Yanofskybacteria bacterium RIFCSPLOWO2_01_FULL_49_25]